MDLYAKAAELGVQTGFHDGQGQWHTTDAAALAIILDSLPAQALKRGPDRVMEPGQAFSGTFDRIWMLAVQLYGLRSERNWGIGDFTDLQNLIRVGASLGAGGIGLNPLHALFDDRPAECSPYAPNSRLFLNPLYIDVEALPEFAGAADRELRPLRDAALVNYPAVAAAKWKALRAAFAQFRSDPAAPRQAAFAAFRNERAPLLTRFACFEVQRHRYRSAWWEWPPEWRQPDDARCADLRAGQDSAEVAFIEYVQWNADLQLKACCDLARELKMPVGLYLDVAVGVQAGGFDAWNEQTSISRHLSIGAPPDALQPAGQNWGLAGFNAAGLEAQEFAPFREMLRAAMRYAGAIRLDHVLGLNRLYVVPHGYGPDNGAYVKMPLEALFAVAAQESVAHRCVVIGEDLGTVPEGFRERMAAWGIWSYRVMMFERGEDYAFRGVDDYAPNALVTFNTHDLPTYAGWRSYHDLHLKRSLGIDPGESDDARRYAIEMLDAALRRQGIDRTDFFGVAGFLARTRTRLEAMALEDLLGVGDQPNIPGTIDEHPNWRQRLPVSVETLCEAIDRDALRTATADRRASARA